MDKPYMLTTIDNPYNPFSNFAEWFMYDAQNNYNTCEVIGRVAKTSDQLTDEENEEELDRAMTQILENDVLGIYKKVFEDDKIVSNPLSIDEKTNNKPTI